MDASLSGDLESARDDHALLSKQKSFHLCGAYQRNRARRRGLLDERGNPDQEHVSLIASANHKIQKRMDERF